MLPPGLETPREVVLHYDKVYFDLIDSGKAHPFIYPWSGVGAFAVIAYLLIDHRRSLFLKRCRYLVFAFLFAFAAYCIFYTRARNPASAFGDGLLSAWGTLWVFAIMVANDCQTDFERIERQGRREEAAVNGTGSNRHVKGGTEHPSLRQRKQDSDAKAPPADQAIVTDTSQFYWQGYPSSSSYVRLDWIADVFCGFRGVGWNWQTSGIPPPPEWVEASLRGEEPASRDAESFTVSRSGVRRFADRTALIKDTVTKLTIGYLALDLAATLIHRDPYFWGYMDAAAPEYLPSIIQQSYFLTNTYRLLLSLGGVYTALWTIFKLGPLFFAGILGPRWVGVRGEAWMNPADHFGSFSMVFSDGLAGWWGGWWHQTFRFAFEAPTSRLLETLNVNKRSVPGKAISLFVAFFLSGCLHASGSYTQLGDTRPLMGPMRFFLLQAVAILGQTVTIQQLKHAGVVERTPQTLRRFTNFVVVQIWLYYTAPFLMDDFAKGGVWLFEPVPFSPLRGLGLGAPDDRFFCWDHGLVWWRTGKHFWDTGIAL